MFTEVEPALLPIVLVDDDPDLFDSVQAAVSLVSPPRPVLDHGHRRFEAAR